MFKDESQLMAMAKIAKENLSKQQVVEDNSGEDIYEEIRNMAYGDDSDVNFDNSLNGNVPRIENDTNDYDYNYDEISGEANQDYYDSYPDYNIESDASNRIFPGGPNKAMLDSWKKQWEGYGMFITEIADIKFVFRTLNRVEYKQIVALQNIDALQREEIICETVTLWPLQFTWDEMATGKAGIPSTYAEIIMSKSGFTKEYSIQVL